MCYVRRADRPAAQLEIDRGQQRPQTAAGDPEHELAHRAPGLLLGLVHHRENRGLRRLGVDDLAGAQTFGQLVTAALAARADRRAGARSGGRSCWYRRRAPQPARTARAVRAAATG